MSQPLGTFPDMGTWVTDSLRSVRQALIPAETSSHETVSGGSDDAAQLQERPDIDSESRRELCRLLEANDGEMYQSAVVEATTWSKSTVSRHLSALEDKGHLERNRQGREKIVRLKDPPASAVQNRTTSP